MSIDNKLTNIIFTMHDWRYHYLKKHTKLLSKIKVNNIVLLQCHKFLIGLCKKTVFYFVNITGAGHDTYWCSNHYLNAVDNVDRLLGQLLQAIGNKPVLVTVSSDHGGDTGHGHMRDSNKLVSLFV